MNIAMIIGRLTRDPELRYTPGGTAVCNFTLAVDKELSRDKKQELEAQNKPTADFINIVTWGKQAENVANYTSKGLKVAVQGNIQTGSYTDKDGNRRNTFDINAYRVEFLEWKENDNQGNYNGPANDMQGFNPVDNDDIPF